MAKQKKQSAFQKLYKSLSDSQKSLFAMYRQMSVCLAIPGNSKVCETITAYYAEAQQMQQESHPADLALPSERSEQEDATPVVEDSCVGKES